MNLDAATPLFLACPPRSGSTFVGRALNSHPDIELTDAAGWVSYLRRAELLSGTPGSQAIDDGEGFTPAAQIPDHYVDHTRAAFRASLPGFVSGLFDSLTGGSPPRYWGDKIHSWQDAAFAARHFAGARFVVLVRDLRDVLVSSYTFEAKQAVAWAGAPLETRCEHLAKMVSGYLDELPEAARHVLRYEQVCTDPQSAFGGVFDWIGADFAPEVHAWLDGPGAALFQSHGTSKAPSESIGRWHRDLDDHQREVCEQICGPVLERLGYAS